ncbi:hypothetical protein M406DRAFT_321106 [Cryphonectria parasitica EP155]|uniref:Uncharacterized protein n=1 Tax=Cryphonectria parasitica (strain ATCC 38755 / EP155) TaxID=660469 RepID=A0A9P5CS69_CRYP1|nr:uncharacterized protein M406DRAFT_321106 [Cryphonectria parasitica EP155]KAF3768993.1 hypothetical protein M406DRAFT_321106 [Cryphonectria parasitica EP155]
MLPSPAHTPVDRRSSRVYGSQMHARSDSLTPRPQSAGGGGASGPGSLRSVRSSNHMRNESPIRGPPTPQSATPNSASHTRNASSTFDDILKDMSNQKDGSKKAPKKKFGL